MSMRMQAAINHLAVRVEDLETLRPGKVIPVPPNLPASVYNQLSEMAARIQELEYRVQTLEAKRKPGRPRKDER